jgi:hypothetical protein
LSQRNINKKMLEFLEELKRLRGLEERDAAFFADVTRLKVWQRARLARTYKDLAADARYAPATAFFLDELYGGKDSAIRDRDLIRMYPTIKRVLPAFAFETVSKAIELDVISEQFDQAVTRLIGKAAITEISYAAAFALAGHREERLRQVRLMRDVGEQLDVVVKKPLIYSTLKMLRTPAKLAGLAAMQQFLEEGFTAFRHMKGADYFLTTIAERETRLIERIFGGHPQPFL